MAVTLGVDQGLSGGLCWLTGLTDNDFKSVISMPTRKAAVKGNRPDLHKIREWLNPLVREWGSPALVLCERSQAMQKADGKTGGPAQVHTQGFNAGMIFSMFDVFRWPIEEPTPQQWKKAVLSGVSKKDKAAMIAACQQRFPSLSLLASSQSKKPHDGIADAVGLALYGQYRIGNVPT